MINVNRNALIVFGTLLVGLTLGNAVRANEGNPAADRIVPYKSSLTSSEPVSIPSIVMASNTSVSNPPIASTPTAVASNAPATHPSESASLSPSPAVMDSNAPLNGSATASTATSANMSDSHTPESASLQNASPVREVTFPLKEIALQKNLKLTGVRYDAFADFGIRSDEVVTQATVNLQYITSPSLSPITSHLKLYLNDELMGVVPIKEGDQGQKTRATIPLDPQIISDFNRLRISFVGHDEKVCENLASSSLWLDLGQNSTLTLRLQRLPLKNDLSHLPEPFFDKHDIRPLVLPVIFAGQPDLLQQRAAVMLTSWFSSQSQWRGHNFPVFYNQLPQQNAIVLATNDKRPDFLRNYPAVNGPTVAMISHPEDPYSKLLLIMGRNEDDLLIAVRGIAQGNMLFRGDQVVVNQVEQLQPRQPYDVPKWIRTDRPVTFAELQQYENQMQSEGLEPAPILLDFNLPPDLYLVNNRGIDMKLNYRYTTPYDEANSRLKIMLNNQFLFAYPLQNSSGLLSEILRVPLSSNQKGATDDYSIPSLKLGANNQLSFEFEYANLLSRSKVNTCESISVPYNQVMIDGTSSIDLTGYRHFIALPDLRVFANTGFPFSRLADLSQTLVLVGKTPQPYQVSALLNVVGNIASQTGYPSLAVNITDDWTQAKTQDRDLLVLGNIPAELHDDTKLGLLSDKLRDWITHPVREQSPTARLDETNLAPDVKVTVSATEPMSAIVGIQSPFNEDRSIVGLLADSEQGYNLLNQALGDSGKRAAMFGSISVIRNSGVMSLWVGDVYYVGYLPWWERIWFSLTEHPMMLSLVAIIFAFILSIVLWRVLRKISRRRLSPDE